MSYPLDGKIPAEPIVHRLWEQGATAREMAAHFSVPLPPMERYLRLRIQKWEASQNRAPAPDTRKVVHTVRCIERGSYQVMHVSLPRISMHVQEIEGRKDADWKVAA
jgi:hypothetical protein